METQFKDQKNTRRQREGLQVIPTIQKMLTAVFITIGIISMISIPMEAKSNISGAKRITEKKVFSCKTPPKGIQTTTLHLILHKFEIPNSWNDAGWAYEINTSIYFKVYPNEKSKKVVCKHSAHWGERDYSIPNVKVGYWLYYPLDFELIIKNVPVNGRVEYEIVMTEIDDSDIEHISFMREDHSGEYLVAYPSKNIAYLTSFGNEFSDPMHLVNFGKSKRVIGTRVDSEEDTVGKLDFTISDIQPKVKGAARIDKVGFCRKYALTAVDLNKKAHIFRCANLFPPVWSNNHQKHYDWCLQNGNDNFAAKENQNRKSALEKCKTDNSVKYCRMYAQTAIDQFNRSRKPGCKVSGIGWSPDYGAHYKWCIDTFLHGNISTLAAEKTRRETMLSNCK